MSPHLEDLAIDLANPEIEIHSHTDTFRNAREPGHRNGNDLESDRPPTGSLRIVLAHLPPDVRARVLDDPDALAEARRLCTAIPAPRPDTDAHRGLTAWGGVHGVSPVLKRLRRLARSRGPCERCGAEAGAGRGFRTLPDGRPCPVCLPRKAA